MAAINASNSCQRVSAAAPLQVADFAAAALQAAAPAKPVNPLFEKRPKTFGETQVCPFADECEGASCCVDCKACLHSHWFIEQPL